VIDLTPRQEQVLRFVGWSITERGYPPTLREICDGIGIRSTNGANDHVCRLVAKGMVKRRSAIVARGIVLTPLGRAFLDKHPAPGVVVGTEEVI
jgi:SOS-response transcriptional repressor LexA